MTMAQVKTNMISMRGGNERSAAPIPTQVTIGTVAGWVTWRTAMVVKKMGTDDEPKEGIVKKTSKTKI